MAESEEELKSFLMRVKEESEKAGLGSMHNTGCLGQVHWDDPEGWYGEGGGQLPTYKGLKSQCFSN